MRKSFLISFVVTIGAIAVVASQTQATAAVSAAAPVPAQEASFGARQAAGGTQAATNIFKSKQTKSVKVGNYEINAGWDTCQPARLMQVTIFHPRLWGFSAGDVKVQVFDNQGEEVECKPLRDPIFTIVTAVEIVRNGDAALQEVVYFKITTDRPDSLACVEITFKNKTHLLEFHDPPQPPARR